MKKIIRFIFAVSICVCLLATGLTVAAYDVINYDNIEVIFKQNSVFSDTEKDIISKSFFEEDKSNETYGLKCILFGHDYKTECVSVIQHKVSESNPRCINEIYETQICEDCSDTQSTLISWEFIECCD